MIRKKQYISIVFLIGILAVTASALALDTEEIDDVCQRALNNESLDADDLEVIDSFLFEALEELLLSEDFSEIIGIKTEISARKGGSEHEQYSSAFIASAQKHLKSAFDELQEWDQNELKTHIERNLIILVAEMESVDLIEFGISKLNAKDCVIRYWAVKSIANSRVAGYLNSEVTGDSELAGIIIGKLENMAQRENRAEILDLIAGFADRFELPEARGLLLKIADLRINAYADWKVEYELMDTGLLKSLANEILSQASDQQKVIVARKFAQLYSYVMQKYILGAKLLNEASKRQLASVMVEVEYLILDKLLGRPQSTIKRAIEKKSLSSLQREHDSLLGSNIRIGELGRRLNFDYGKSPGGRAITAPKTLPPPP